jgi:hypothetical protein
MFARYLLHAVTSAVVVLAPSVTQAAQTQLVFHWDRQAGISRAMVVGPGGDVLAEFPWDGALPRAYAAEIDEMETPTLLLAQLRDQLEAGGHPDAAGALSFIRDLMGAHADTPAADLPPSLGTWISYGEIQATEWCGVLVSSQGACVQGEAEGSAFSSLCRNFACKSTTIEPKVD